MTTTICSIATKNGDIRVKVFESAALLYLTRFIGSLGVLYILTIGTTAIALRYFIVVKPKLFFYDVNGRIEYTRLARHEFIHIVQQKELGVLRFLYLYLVYSLKYGYFDNPFEREARAHQDEVWYLMKREKNNWRNYI